MGAGQVVGRGSFLDMVILLEETGMACVILNLIAETSGQKTLLKRLSI